MITHTSKVITTLRWPMAVLVILCHAQFLDGFKNHPIEAWSSWKILAGWQVFISEVLPHVAVPLFMLFSGYLLFGKGPLTFERYKATLATGTVGYFSLDAGRTFSYRHAGLPDEYAAVVPAQPYDSDDSVVPDRQAA